MRLLILSYEHCTYLYLSVRVSFSRCAWGVSVASSLLLFPSLLLSHLRLRLRLRFVL